MYTCLVVHFWYCSLLLGTRTRTHGFFTLMLISWMPSQACVLLNAESCACACFTGGNQSRRYCVDITADWP